MKAVVAAFNQEKALVGAFSVITNLRMELFQALVATSPVQVYEEPRPEQQHKGSSKLSPKHQIRSPIMEETESTVERALLSRGRQGSYSQLGSSLGGDHQVG